MKGEKTRSSESPLVLVLLLIVRKCGARFLSEIRCQFLWTLVLVIRPGVVRFIKLIELGGVVFGP